MKYGLALGGGAAKGLIHIGVLQYLEEKGIEIEAISGTSMGAIIGIAIAQGFSAKKIQKIAKEVNVLTLLDTNLSMGLIKGKKIMNFFKDVFGDCTFSDLQIPLTITATDLHTGNLHSITQGSVLDAMRASISLPTIFAPFEKDDGLFVDGGVMCNLPVDFLDTEKIIAVSTMGVHDKIKKSRKVFGFDLSYNFLTYNAKVLEKTIQVMMLQNEEKSLQNKKNVLLIRPEIKNIGFYDFHKVDACCEIGYSAMQEIFTKNT